MKKSILVLASVCLLGLPSFGVEPVATFLDFLSSTSAPVEDYAFTATVGGSPVASETVTISDHPLKLTCQNSWNCSGSTAADIGITILLKYSGLTNNSEDHRAVITSSVGGDNSQVGVLKAGTTIANSTYISNKEADNGYGIWAGALWDDANNTMGEAIPESGYLVYQWRFGSEVSGARLGTQLYTSNGTQLYSVSALGTETNPNVQYIYIGGTSENKLLAKRMVIEGVRIYRGILESSKFTDAIKAFEAIKTADLSTSTTWSEITWKDENGSSALAENDSAFLRVDGDVTVTINEDSPSFSFLEFNKKQNPTESSSSLTIAGSSSLKATKTSVNVDTTITNSAVELGEVVVADGATLTIAENATLTVTRISGAGKVVWGSIDQIKVVGQEFNFISYDSSYDSVAGRLVFDSTLSFGQHVYIQPENAAKTYACLKIASNGTLSPVTLADLQTMQYDGKMRGGWIGNSDRAAYGYRMAIDGTSIEMQMQTYDNDTLKCVRTTLEVDDAAGTVKISAGDPRYDQSNDVSYGFDFYAQNLPTSVKTPSNASGSVVGLATTDGGGSYGIHTLTLSPATVGVQSKGRNYTDFATALTEASEGDELSLWADSAANLSITKSIVLKLNGHNLSGALTVADGKTLTVVLAESELEKTVQLNATGSIKFVKGSATGELLDEGSLYHGRRTLDLSAQTEGTVDYSDVKNAWRGGEPDENCKAFIKIGSKTLTLTMDEEDETVAELEVSGTGTLTLSGSKRFYVNDKLVVNANLTAWPGQLRTQDAVALPPTEIQDGTTLTYSQASGITATIPSLSGAGKLVKGAAGTLKITGAIANGINLTINAGTLALAGDKTIAGTITGEGAVKIESGIVTFSGTNNYTGGTTIASGATLSIGSMMQVGGYGKNVQIDSNGTLIFTSTANNADEESSNLSNISGTGKVKYQGAGYRLLPKSSANRFLSTLALENEQADGLIITGNNASATVVTEVGTLSGSKPFRVDWGAPERILRIVQSDNSTYSGGMIKLTKSSNNEINWNRIQAIKVAGAANAAVKTLTLTGETEVDPLSLIIEKTGSVDLASTAWWKGSVTVEGRIGGTGHICGSLTLKSGTVVDLTQGALRLDGSLSLEDGVIFEVNTLPKAGETIIIQKQEGDGKSLTVVNGADNLPNVKCLFRVKGIEDRLFNLKQDENGNVVINQMRNPVAEQGRVQMAYNYCTLSYTMALWSEKEWEAEIDRLANAGFTHVLVNAGMEKVWYDFLTHLSEVDYKKADGSAYFTDYTDGEARAHIPHPAWRAWWLMGNLEGEGELLGEDHGLALTQDEIERQANIGRTIMQKCWEKGMTPVVNSFMGLMPIGFVAGANAKYSELSKLDQSVSWDHYQRPDQLLPTDPSFKPLARAYHKALFGVYGIDNSKAVAFSGDLFHEGGAKPSNTSVTTQSAIAVQEAQQEARPGALWLVQHWQDNPVRELQSGLDPRCTVIQTLVRDLTFFKQVSSDKSAMGPPYQGRDINEDRNSDPLSWVWSEVTSFGGRAHLYGSLDRMKNARAYLDDVSKDVSCVGWAMLDEDTSYQKYYYYQMFDIFGEGHEKSEATGYYTKSKEATPWLNLATRNDSKTAWDLLEQSIFKPLQEQQGCTTGLLCARPHRGFNIGKAYTWSIGWNDGGQYYDKYMIRQAAQFMLDSLKEDADTKNGGENKLATDEAWRELYIDAMRQVASDAFTVMVYDHRETPQTRNLKGLVEALDQLLRRSNYATLTYYWEQAKKLAASTVDEKGETVPGIYDESVHKKAALRHYRNFICLITNWNQDLTGDLDDYAFRLLGGLMVDYYWERWQMYFDGATDDAIKQRDLTYWKTAPAPTEENGFAAVAPTAEDLIKIGEKILSPEYDIAQYTTDITGIAPMDWYDFSDTTAANKGFSRREWGGSDNNVSLTTDHENGQGAIAGTKWTKVSGMPAFQSAGSTVSIVATLGETDNGYIFSPNAGENTNADGNPWSIQRSATGTLAFVNLFKSETTDDAETKTVAGLGDTMFHHIVVTRQDNTITVWVDGVQKLNGTAVATLPAYFRGFQVNKGWGAENSIRTGAVDDLRIYNAVLTQDQIEAIYSEFALHTWTDGEVDNEWSWSTGANWSSGVAPAAGKVIISVPGATTMTLSTNPKLQNLQITEGTGTEQKLTLSGAGTLATAQTSIGCDTDVSAITANLGVVTIAAGKTLTIGAQTTIDSLVAENGAKLEVVMEDGDKDLSIPATGLTKDSVSVIQDTADTGAVYVTLNSAGVSFSREEKLMMGAAWAQKADDTPAGTPNTFYKVEKGKSSCVDWDLAKLAQMAMAGYVDGDWITAVGGVHAHAVQGSYITKNNDSDVTVQFQVPDVANNNSVIKVVHVKLTLTKSEEATTITATATASGMMNGTIVNGSNMSEYTSGTVATKPSDNGYGVWGITLSPRTIEIPAIKANYTDLADALQMVRASQTVNVLGDVTLTRDAIVAEGVTLTIAESAAVTVAANTTLTLSSTARPATSGGAIDLTAEGAKLAVYLEEDTENVNLHVTGLENLDDAHCTSKFEVYDETEDSIASPTISYHADSQTVTIYSGAPRLKLEDETSVTFNTWQDKNSSEVIIEVLENVDGTLTISENASVECIYLTGKGEITVSGDGTLSAERIHLTGGVTVTADKLTAGSIELEYGTQLIVSDADTVSLPTIALVPVEGATEKTATIVYGADHQRLVIDSLAREEDTSYLTLQGTMNMLSGSYGYDLDAYNALSLQFTNRPALGAVKYICTKDGAARKGQLQAVTFDYLCYGWTAGMGANVAVPTDNPENAQWDVDSLKTLLGMEFTAVLKHTDGTTHLARGYNATLNGSAVTIDVRPESGEATPVVKVELTLATTANANEKYDVQVKQVGTSTEGWSVYDLSMVTAIARVGANGACYNDLTKAIDLAWAATNHELVLFENLATAEELDTTGLSLVLDSSMTKGGNFEVTTKLTGAGDLAARGNVTLTNAETVSGALKIEAGSELTLDAGDASWTLGGKVTNAGTLNAKGNISLTNTGNTTIGTLNVQSGCLTMEAKASGGDGFKGTINIEPGAELKPQGNYSMSVTGGTVNIKGTLTLNCVWTLDPSVTWNYYAGGTIQSENVNAYLNVNANGKITLNAVTGDTGTGVIQAAYKGNPIYHVAENLTLTTLDISQVKESGEAQLTFTADATLTVANLILGTNRDFMGEASKDKLLVTEKVTMTEGATEGSPLQLTWTMDENATAEMMMLNGGDPLTTKEGGGITYDSTKGTFTFNTTLTGKGCWFEWTFKDAQKLLDSTGRDTRALGPNTIGVENCEKITESDYAILLSAGAVQDHLDYTKSLEAPSWSASFFARMPSNVGGTLVSFGSSASTEAGEGCLALVRGLAENQVVLVYLPPKLGADSPEFQVLADMKVPHAETDYHLYTFVVHGGDPADPENNPRIEIFLDTTLWTKVSGRFGVRYGVKMGDLYYWQWNSDSSLGRYNETPYDHYGYVNGGRLLLSQAQDVAGDDTPGAIDMLRIYDCYLEKAEVSRIAAEYKYESPYGSYTRTVEGDGDLTWSSENMWKIGSESVAYPKDGMATLIAKADASVAINMTEAVELEGLTLAGEQDAKITLTTAETGTEHITVTGNTQVTTEAQIDLNAISLEGPVNVADNTILTLVLTDTLLDKWGQEYAQNAHDIVKNLTGYLVNPEANIQFVAPDEDENGGWKLSQTADGTITFTKRSFQVVIRKDAATNCWVATFNREPWTVTIDEQNTVTWRSGENESYYKPDEGEHYLLAGGAINIEAKGSAELLVNGVTSGMTVTGTGTVTLKVPTTGAEVTTLTIQKLNIQDSANVVLAGNIIIPATAQVTLAPESKLTLTDGLVALPQVYPVTGTLVWNYAAEQETAANFGSLKMEVATGTLVLTGNQTGDTHAQTVTVKNGAKLVLRASNKTDQPLGSCSVVTVENRGAVELQQGASWISIKGAGTTTVAGDFNFGFGGDGSGSSQANQNTLETPLVVSADKTLTLTAWRAYSVDVPSLDVQGTLSSAVMCESLKEPAVTVSAGNSLTGAGAINLPVTLKDNAALVVDKSNNLLTVKSLEATGTLKVNVSEAPTTGTPQVLKTESEANLTDFKFDITAGEELTPVKGWTYKNMSDGLYLRRQGFMLMVK